MMHGGETEVGCGRRGLHPGVQSKGRGGCQEACVPGERRCNIKLDQPPCQHNFFQADAVLHALCQRAPDAMLGPDVASGAAQDLSQSSEELVDKYVQKSVWEAVAGYDGEGKKSEVRRARDCLLSVSGGRG